MTNATSPAGAFGYRYPAGSPTPHSTRLDLPNGAYISKSFDSVSRLLSTVLYNSTNRALNAHSYGCDLAGLRTSLTNTFGDYRLFTNDLAGQLVGAHAYESNGTPRSHEQFGYSYDPAFNLSRRTNNALVQTFAVDELNQLRTVGRSGTLTVAGATSGRATNVTVNGVSAALYLDNTFAQGGFTLADGANSFTAIAQNSSGRKDTNTVTSFLPATVSLVYDLNGNLRTNGLEILEYDDENQLATNWVAGSWKSEFAYDGLHRRRIERNYTWSSGAWSLQSEVHFVYDGTLPLQHRDANNTPILTLTRGLDLSESLHGAGGIGGLLATTEASGTNSYYHADGGGNVTCLINSGQLIVGRYGFDPFGAALLVSGPKAGLNPYRFSSKPQHGFSGKYDFLYRWYAPELQRWLSRDPLQEEGGINLYGFTSNRPVGGVDPLGFSDFNAPPAITITGQWHHGIPYNNSTYDFANHPLVKNAGWTETALRDKQDAMFLEKHAGPHSPSYLDEVQRRMDLANKALEEAGIRDPAEYEKALRDVYRQILKDIECGKLQPYDNKTVKRIPGYEVVPYRKRPRGAIINRTLNGIGLGLDIYFMIEMMVPKTQSQYYLNDGSIVDEKGRLVGFWMT